MSRKYAAAALFAAAILNAGPARADHFGVRAEGGGPGAAGVVTSYGIDLLPIRSNVGGLAPLERSAVISTRLEAMEEAGLLKPELFSVGYRNHEVVLQYLVMGERKTHILVTVDRSLAAQTRGAGGDVERLAEWWLALVQDHIGLAIGLKPQSTAGTPVGVALAELHALVSLSPGPVAPAFIRATVPRLPLQTQQILRNAPYEIPKEFEKSSLSGGREMVVDLGPDAQTSGASDAVQVVSPSNPPEAAAPTGASVAVAAPPPAPTVPSPPVQVPAAADTAAAADAKPENAGSNGNQAVGSAPLTTEQPHHAAGYRVELSTLPAPLLAGKEGKITLKIDVTSPTDTVLTPVAGARLLGRINLALGAGEPRWMLVRPAEERPGVYSFKTTLKDPGSFRMNLTAILSNGETFMAQLVLRASAGKPGSSDAVVSIP